MRCMRVSGVDLFQIVGTRILLFGLILLGATGCSVDYVDEQGRRHIVGFAHIVTEAQSLDCVHYRVRTAGLAVYAHPSASGVGLGWSDEEFSYAEVGGQNGCTLLDVSGPDAEPAAGGVR